MTIALSVVAALCTPSRGEAFDAAKFETIPPIEIVKLATAQFSYIGVDDATRDKALKAIDAFDPKVQTLVWLAFVDTHLSEPSNVPTFYSWTGYFFPQILKALRDSGMTRQARIFREAWSHPKPIASQLPADFSKDSDFRQIDLGLDFGDKRAFEADILAYIRGTPAVAVWYDEMHAHLSDELRLDALVAALVRVPDSYKWEVLQTWPASYRTLMLVSTYQAEVINGGVEQFFSNSSGDLAPATANALRAVGLPRQAAVVERGMSFFPDPYPTERMRRMQVLKPEGLEADVESGISRKLDTLTSEAPFGEPIRAAMAAYGRHEHILPR